MQQKEVIIVGGGLAGLTAGIHMALKGFAVLIIDKNTYPAHKVCGEYLSNEALPYLHWLGVNLRQGNPAITQFIFSESSRKEPVSAALPLGGTGISRYKLDYLLYKRAIELGCVIIKDTVKDITYNEGHFTVTSESNVFTSGLVFGAFGKWSNIDKALARSFAFKKSLWIAVKAHYKYNMLDNEVALYNFSGGYCGVSKVEDNMVNICYLARNTAFQKHKNITAFQNEVVFKNKGLKDVLSSATMLYDKPITISRISFERKKQVENHVLMIGDSAGLIHPLCGNGMAMAIHSAKIASELSIDFLKGKTTRPELEKNYKKLWYKYFNKRIFMGRLLAKLIASPLAMKPLFMLLGSFPFLMRFMIRQTHGNVISV
jgi:flavin-dependent dehydrogenase